MPDIVEQNCCSVNEKAAQQICRTWAQFAQPGANTALAAQAPEFCI
jgi:hypothetical protein